MSTSVLGHPTLAPIFLFMLYPQGQVYLAKGNKHKTHLCNMTHILTLTTSQCFVSFCFVWFSGLAWNYAHEDDPEPLILLLSCPKCCRYRHAPVRLVSRTSTSETKTTPDQSKKATGLRRKVQGHPGTRLVGVHAFHLSTGT